MTMWERSKDQCSYEHHCRPSAQTKKRCCVVVKSLDKHIFGSQHTSVPATTCTCTAEGCLTSRPCLTLPLWRRLRALLRFDVHRLWLLCGSWQSFSLVVSKVDVSY